MKIEFNQNEIISGLRMYIESQGISLAGKDVSVDFTAGRGATGLSAEVNIEAQNFKSLTAGVTPKTVAELVSTSVDPTPVAVQETLTADGVTEGTAGQDTEETTTEGDPSSLGNKASLFS